MSRVTRTQLRLSLRYTLVVATRIALVLGLAQDVEMAVAVISGAFLHAVLEKHFFVTPPAEYYSRRNKFERFRGFLELISRFEFEFCRRENYFF